jgi:hypothetical protein
MARRKKRKVADEEGWSQIQVDGVAGEKWGIIGGERYAIYETDAMRAHMQAFSRGVRTCLGKGIALVELALATAALAQRFGRVRLADAQQTVADMRVTDHFLLSPKGKRCQLVFE